MDLKPKHASALQKQFTPQMWEQARQRQEATILRPSSEKVGVDSPPITHQVAMTATPPKDPGLMDVTSFHFQATSLPNRLAYGVCWRSRVGDLLPVRRWRRRPVDALARRTLREGDVSIMVSGSPEFGERTTRSEVRREEASTKQQTNYFGNHENAPVGRGGGDRAVVVEGQGRTRDAAPIGTAGTLTRGGRTSAREKETTPTWLEEIPSGRDQGTQLAVERNIPICGPNVSARSRRR